MNSTHRAIVIAYAGRIAGGGLERAVAADARPVRRHHRKMG